MLPLAAGVRVGRRWWSAMAGGVSVGPVGPGRMLRGALRGVEPRECCSCPHPGSREGLWQGLPAAAVGPPVRRNPASQCIPMSFISRRSLKAIVEFIARQVGAPTEGAAAAAARSQHNPWKEQTAAARAPPPAAPPAAAAVPAAAAAPATRRGQRAAQQQVQQQQQAERAAAPAAPAPPASEEGEADKARSFEAPPPPPRGGQTGVRYGPRIVGQPIWVWWPDDRRWYRGQVSSYGMYKGRRWVAGTGVGAGTQVSSCGMWGVDIWAAGCGEQAGMPSASLGDSLARPALPDCTHTCSILLAGVTPPPFVPWRALTWCVRSGSLRHAGCTALDTKMETWRHWT